MTTGRVDTDQAALAVRANVNDRGAINLEEFMCEKLGLQGDEIVLELGSGTGKQTAYLRARYPDMPIISVDKAVTHVHGGPSTILTADMDELAFSPLFDVVLAVYSLYYSMDMMQLARRVRKWLKPGGQFLVMGPGAGTNKELVELTDAYAEKPMPPVVPFLPDWQMAAIASVYDSVWSGGFTNVIEFTTPAEFFSWWENHNSYDVEQRKAIEAHVPEKMRLTKCVDCFIFKVKG